LSVIPGGRRKGGKKAYKVQDKIANRAARRIQKFGGMVEQSDQRLQVMGCLQTTSHSGALCGKAKLLSTGIDMINSACSHSSRLHPLAAVQIVPGRRTQAVPENGRMPKTFEPFSPRNNFTFYFNHLSFCGYCFGT
jgi:hypothetical protein